MPERHRMMPLNTHPSSHRSPRPPFPTAPPVDPAPVPSDEDELWQGPTLRELIDRVEHQFGQAPALASLFTLGFGRDEPLTPGDIQAVCEHLGLPATDFGLDP